MGSKDASTFGAGAPAPQWQSSTHEAVPGQGDRDATESGQASETGQDAGRDDPWASGILCRLLPSCHSLSLPLLAGPLSFT